MGILTEEVVRAGLAEADRLAAGEVPDPEVLAAAPLLRDWLIEPQSSGYFRLYGRVTGHPEIPDGWCTTSPVLHVGPDEAWVRTVSRFYRLGPPLREKMRKSDA